MNKSSKRMKIIVGNLSLSFKSVIQSVDQPVN